MRRMASPAALSRTLSLQRANARAKSSRAESLISDQKSGNSQLSKRIDILFTSVSSSTNNVTDSCNIDTQSKPAVCEPSKKLAKLQVHDGNYHNNAMKRSLSADIPSGYKACFSSLSERIDRGIDLWDHDFSSMSSYASEHDGFLCGLRLNSDSSYILCEPVKGKEDACIKSSWSEDSFVDAIQMEDVASSDAYRLQGLGIDCTSGSHSYVVNQNLQCGVCGGHSLQASSDKHTLLLPQYDSADYEGAEIVYKASRSAGNLEEYLNSRGGYLTKSLQVGASCIHSIQEASARDGDEYEETKISKSEGQNSSTGSSKSEADEEGEGIISSKKDNKSLYRMRVRSKRDCDKLEEEIISSNNVEEESKRDKDRCRKRVEGYEEEEIVEGRGPFIGGLPPDSVAVELVSVNVVEDFRESMYEMMMEKNMEEECGDSSMHHLLNCYLLLNPSYLHGLIREVFSDVWIDIIMTIR